MPPAQLSRHSRLPTDTDRFNQNNPPGIADPRTPPIPGIKLIRDMPRQHADDASRRLFWGGVVDFRPGTVGIFSWLYD